MALETGKGQIYKTHEAAISQLPLVDNLLALNETERMIIKVIITLAASNPDRVTTQGEVADYFKRANSKTKISRVTIKIRVSQMYKIGLFNHSTFKRIGRGREGVIYTLKDLIEACANPELTTPSDSQMSIAPVEKSLLRAIFDDGNATALDAQYSYRVSYSRKINNLILPRCSGDEKHLGKKVTTFLPGINETVSIVQRTASGIPPMNGSEDRLQQALLTMFKEHLKNHKKYFGSLSDIRNEWVIDMREVCKVMGLASSTGNMEIQAKKLFQLRHNTFEIYFTPGGKAAKAFRFTREDHEAELYKDSDDQIYSLESNRFDHSFLSLLEPVRDKIITQDLSLQTLPGIEPAASPKYQQPIDGDVSDAGIDKLVRDDDGRLFRFYRISFHPRIFAECIDEEMKQIFVQPPSLLQEERVIVRLLVELAQRICGKSRKAPFSVSWGALAKEIQPLNDPHDTFHLMRLAFASEHARQYEGGKWNPREPNALSVHGYIFSTEVPKGAVRKAERWILTIARDPEDPFTGENNPSLRLATSTYDQ